LCLLSVSAREKLAIDPRIVKSQTFAISKIKNNLLPIANMRLIAKPVPAAKAKKKMAPQVAGPPPLREKLVEG
jgi:hypothetical protein